MSVVCIVNVSVIKPSQRPSTAQREAWAAFGADLSNVSFGSGEYRPEWQYDGAFDEELSATPARRLPAGAMSAETEEVSEQVPVGREMHVEDLEERHNPGAALQAEQEGSTNDRRGSFGSDKILVSVVPHGERKVDADQRSQASPVGSNVSEKGKESCCARFCAWLTCSKKS